MDNMSDDKDKMKNTTKRSKRNLKTNPYLSITSTLLKNYKVPASIGSILRIRHVAIFYFGTLNALWWKIR
jgi:hypothetical protein